MPSDTLLYSFDDDFIIQSWEMKFLTKQALVMSIQ